ncbi:MAG: hypothetical protein KKF46_08065 [Nanoarchaeota archaeon]|nr:hypothetical protein [Nanoarchaeota archaeon]MBU1322283.1 hypothetical protein [Nanoarchaeota archaeon]MBU1598036.1 hypothetical protein [Nanoarchaeota archaeon]MBU2440998.1 hypothetical protein [Nanoarchaeota archaeon]
MPTTTKKRKRGRPPKKKTTGKKKPTTQTTDTKTTIQKKPDICKDAPEMNYFVLCNGQPVKNVKELADVMDEIEEHVFDHHVTSDKNDFANWIEDIFKDMELAQKLAGAKEKKHMQLVIYKHITHKLW